MLKRQPKTNEVDKLVSIDGSTVFSVRKRTDKNYEFYIEELKYDEEEDIYYWSQETLPRSHIFGSILDSKAEILAQFGHLLNSN